MRVRYIAALGTVAALTVAGTGVQGQGGRGGLSTSLFTAVDANKYADVTKDELKTAFDKWFTEWDSEKGGTLTQEQVNLGLNTALPVPANAGFFPTGRGRAVQNQTPNPADVQAMLAALPDKAGELTAGVWHHFLVERLLPYMQAGGKATQGKQPVR